MVPGVVDVGAIADQNGGPERRFRTLVEARSGPYLRVVGVTVWRHSLRSSCMRLCTKTHGGPSPADPFDPGMPVSGSTQPVFNCARTPKFETRNGWATCRSRACPLKLFFFCINLEPRAE